MSKRNKDIALDLYTGDGWVNIPSVAALGCWCNIIIGKRQVGKTFGTLKYMLDENKYFLYMRRTVNELQAVAADPDLNPFNALQSVGYDIGILKAGKISYSIGDIEYEDEEDKDGRKKWHIGNKRAVGMALPSIAGIRGFNGSVFSDLVFDEFIPERIIAKRKAEGEALLNAYVTVCGNRELEGKPPLRMWLLANAFDISSPILEQLGCTDLVAKMSRNGKEWCMTDTGVFIAMPHSDRISDRRKQTALMKHLAGKGDFYKMAMENQFVYNNLENVRPRSLKGMTPLFAFAGLYAYQMDELHYYICESPHSGREHYGSSPQAATQLQAVHPELRPMICLGQVDFSSVPALLKTRNYLDIKD